MADSLFASLLNSVDGSAIGSIAHALGQPEQAVSRGIEPSIAALLGGLTSKSNDPSALRKILDIIPSAGGPVSWSQVATSAADPNSPLMSVGKRLLPDLFGNAGSAVTSGLSRSSGLPSGAISTLLTMAGPVVMSFISRYVRDGNMTMSSLGSLLQRESGSFRNALPTELRELFWPAASTASAAASPVVAQTVYRERSANWLLPGLAAAALALGFIWLLSHAHRPRTPQVAVIQRPTTGEANRLATPTNVTCVVPSSVNIPAGGVESRVLAFVQNPDTRVDNTTWFTTDGLLFDNGSARLRPVSQAQLNNIAAILTSCPNVHMTVAGYTDNVGNADSNLRLSRSRANSVVSQLISKGVPGSRLVAEGYGEDHPVADNATPQGRAENRRVALLITQK